MVICDVGTIEAPDLGTVESLALLRVGLSALGCSVRLRAPSARLRELVRFCGLDDLFECEPSALVVQGETEERKQPVGVEEVVETGDPAI